MGRVKFDFKVISTVRFRTAAILGFANTPPDFKTTFPTYRPSVCRASPPSGVGPWTAEPRA